MNKILLIDGNNLLYRSYFATAYNGNFMKNSKGFPTNAIYGFVIMINKVLQEEKPTHVMVAFDKGKTFRHDIYEDYKKGRLETPDELKVQKPIVKELLEAMNLKWYESDMFEADDIIGAFSKICTDKGLNSTIISSDKDLLQLINEKTSIKLLKQKDYIYYTNESFIEEYKIEPKSIIDLKSLQGDPSDNIPGIKGIGEKTALKMIQDFKTLDSVFDNVSSFSPKMQEKLLNGKDDAYLSYKLATIDVDFNEGFNLEDILYEEMNKDEVYKIYEELEFNSLIKRDIKEEEIKYKYLDDYKVLKGEYSLYIEVSDKDYHKGEILGVGIYSKDYSYFIKPENIKVEQLDFTNTYDHKKNIYMTKTNINTKNDLMIMAYLLEYNLKEDISYLANQFGYNILDEKEIKSNEDLEKNIIKKAKFIFDKTKEFKEKLEADNLLDLYNNIELPLIYVLAHMEIEGIKTDSNILSKMEKELDIKIEELNKKIIEIAGVEFNISSPKQLGDILFEKLELKGTKKTKTGYSTDSSVLLRLKNKHEIIPLIIEYRELTKLNSTYVSSLQNYIFEDSKIHTTYNQALTRTGRLSSLNPNLQNIPIRHEEGRKIRKAFIAEDGYQLLSADYSQIELRVLAHISQVEELKRAFNNNCDIHNEVASKLFGVSESDVDSYMRRVAKAVNFGIIYGISSYGLSENLDIDFKEASKLIEDYLIKYPSLKEYMDKVKSDAYETGIVRTMFDRKRSIPEIKNKNYMIRQQGERIALNTPIQGSSADILKIAMINVFNAFQNKGLESKMVLQIHDEIVIQVKDNEVEQVKSIVKECMEQAVKLDVPLLAQISVADNLYDVK